MPVIANNSFKNGGDPSSPPARAFAVTPSDVDELAQVVQSLYVGTVGDLVVIHQCDSVAVTYKAVVGLISGMFRQVKATGTTATNIIARY